MTHRRMNTTPMAAGAKGLFGVLGRAMSGGGLFMTDSPHPPGRGSGCLAAKFRAASWNSTYAGQGYLIHRHGFLSDAGSSWASVFSARSVAASSGRRLHHAKADRHVQSVGRACGESSPTISRRANPAVHPGHVGMFSESLNFDVTLLPGFCEHDLRWRRLVWRGSRARKSMAAALTLPNLAHATRRYLAKTTANRRATRHRRRHRGLRSGGLFGNNR